MKRCLSVVFTGSFLVLLNIAGFSQMRWNDIGEDVISRDTVSKKGFTLVFVNKDSAFDSQVMEKMVATFFKVYPKQAKLYNKKTSRKVIFVIDPAYTGVAATSGHLVRYNPEWFRKHPGDIDVVTHEVMHIVQSYPGGAGPGWITEGIADYVRFTLGVDNPGGGWVLPELNHSHHYNNSYRITARFFVWLEKNGNRNLVKKLDAAMRSKTYTSGFWEMTTGKTLEELWKNYSANPAI